MGGIGHIRGLVRAAEEGATLRLNIDVGVHVSAYRDEKDVDHPYKVVRRAEDGEAAEQTWQFWDKAEWIMKMDDIYSLSRWDAVPSSPNQR